MQSRQYIIAMLATTFLNLFNTQSTHAVSIIYETDIESHINFNKVPYREGNREGQSWVKEDVRVLQRGGTPGLRRLLQEKFPLWTFLIAPPKEGNQSLRGEFMVKQYYACGNLTLCGSPSTFPVLGGVGALFDVDFISGEGDPQFPDRLNWIQRVVSNHSEEPRPYGAHNLKEDRIDIQDRTDSPYYFPTRNNRNFFFPSFYDRPYRPDAENSHYWNAELFLVRELGNQTVMIYDGISWGWKNETKRRREDFCPAKSISSGDDCSYYYFSDSLSSGTEVDNFNLAGLTPGKQFIAKIDNDIPGNRCNPNTYLTAYNNSGYISNRDDNSSTLGDGFASAVKGTVSSDGTIKLDVGAANGGRRGEDRGNYELDIELYDQGETPPDDFFVVAGSGGGGFGDEIQTQGRTQNNPILPNAKEGGWQVFRNVPGCRWYDPHTPYGFEFQALDDTLFTEILDFPVGPDNQFTVSVGDRILGEFGAGDSVDFTSLFGSGISNFKITGIDSLLGSTEETAFPIQLAFNDRIGSFKMRPFSQENSPQPVSESTSALGLLALGAWGIMKALSIRFDK